MSAQRNNIADEELLSLLKDGDRAAFTEIYNRYKGILHMHAYKKLGDFEEAKDIVQEVFATLWDKKEAIPQTTNFSGYLYQMLRNRIFNSIAHKDVASKHIASITDFYNEGSAITDHLVRERELAHRIENEINNLPPKMREVFLLSRKYYLSHKEIAEQLTISEITVRNHVKHALKILRLRMGILGYIAFILISRGR